MELEEEEVGTAATTDERPPVILAKECRIYLQRLDADLLSTVRGRRKLVRQANLSSSEEEDSYRPTRKRTRIQRFGLNSDEEDHDEDSDSEVAVVKRRRSPKKYKNTRVPGTFKWIKTKIGSSEEEEEEEEEKSGRRTRTKTRRRRRVLESEDESEQEEEFPRKSVRTGGTKVKYVIDDDDEEEDEDLEKEVKSDKESDWSESGSGSGSEKENKKEDNYSSSPVSSDFEMSAKTKKALKEKRNNPKPKKGQFLNDGDDFEEIEDGFVMPRRGRPRQKKRRRNKKKVDQSDDEEDEDPQPSEDDGNLSELSLPPSDEEDPDQGVEGLTSFALDLDDNPKEDGGSQVVEGMEVEATGSTEPTNAAPATQDDAEEKARKRRLEYILKRSEFYTKKLTAGGAGGLTGKADSATPGTSAPTAGQGGQRRRSRKGDEADLFLTESSGAAKGATSTPTIIFQSSPSFIVGGEMRDYQVRGLNWLVNLYENGINGILADEMGLGKTLQSISVLAYLKHVKGLQFHALIIVPKSTLSNWINEFRRWCPTLRAVPLIGDKLVRAGIIKGQVKHLKKWDVLVTTYEMVIIEKAVLRKIRWGYLIIDEAHRIKNENAMLSKIVRTLKSRHRLLLTGTPLQNNLHELWALLNFLLPEAFSSAEDFSSWFSETEIGTGSEALIQRLHTILRPFLLRRLKSDVEKGLPPKTEMKIYVSLTALQRGCYKDILLNQFNMLNASGNLTHYRLANIVMHLRKACNHPYLFKGQEPGPPYTCGEHLFTNCGKMLVLDKLLDKLKQEGSRVLLFTSMARMLDILEDYCYLRKIKYHRLDGSTEYTERQRMIDEFNSERSPTFLFMLTTRAGGLGINLASADCVVIYDSDWNPMVDLQAMDRAHRIGQTKEVRVFRLITEDTVEERIVQRAALKLKLDKIVIQQNRVVDKSQNALSAANLLSWIRHSAKAILSSDGVETMPDETIAQILSKSKAKSDEVDQAIDALPENKLLNFATEPDFEVEKDYFDFNGEDFRKQRAEFMRSKKEGKGTTSGYFDVDEGASGRTRRSKKKALEGMRDTKKKEGRKQRKSTKAEFEPSSSEVESGPEEQDDSFIINPDQLLSSDDEEDGAEMDRNPEPGASKQRGPYYKPRHSNTNSNLNPESIAQKMTAITGTVITNQTEIRKCFNLLENGDMQCLFCNMVLKAHGNVNKFIQHFRSEHAVMAGSWGASRRKDGHKSETYSKSREVVPSPPLPELPASRQAVNALSRDVLMSYCTLKNNRITCRVCGVVLEAPGIVRKFRGHLRTHVPPGSGSEPDEDDSSDSPKYLFRKRKDPVQEEEEDADGSGKRSNGIVYHFTKKAVAQMSNKSLREYCQFQRDLPVTCPICRKVVKGDISKFRRHLLSAHAPRGDDSDENNEVQEIGDSPELIILPQDSEQEEDSPSERVASSSNGIGIRFKLSKGAVENMSNTKLKEYCHFENGNITVICSICRRGLKGGLSNFRRHLLLHATPEADSDKEVLSNWQELAITAQDSEQEEEGTSSNGMEFTLSKKAVRTMSSARLRKYCTPQGSQLVCLICGRELNGDISKFRMHLLKVHVPPEDGDDPLGEDTKSETEETCDISDSSEPKEERNQGQIGLVTLTEIISDSSEDDQPNTTHSKTKVEVINLSESEEDPSSPVAGPCHSQPKRVVRGPGRPRQGRKSTYPLKDVTLPPGISLPTSSKQVQAMTNEELKDYYEMKGKGQNITCLICGIELIAYGNVGKFRRHLFSHVTPAKVVEPPKPKSHKKKQSTAKGSFQNIMGNLKLRRYCTFLPDGVISCNICDKKLNAYGNIGKFRRHMRYNHASQYTGTTEEEEENDEVSDDDGILLGVEIEPDSDQDEDKEGDTQEEEDKEEDAQEEEENKEDTQEGAGPQEED